MQYGVNFSIRIQKRFINSVRAAPWNFIFKWVMCFICRNLILNDFLLLDVWLCQKVKHDLYKCNLLSKNDFTFDFRKESLLPKNVYDLKQEYHKAMCSGKFLEIWNIEIYFPITNFFIRTGSPNTNNHWHFIR